MHPNEELFLQLIRGLQREFDEDFAINGNLPASYGAQVSFDKEKVLEYSPWFLSGISELETIYVVLHEMGHVLTIPPYLSRYTNSYDVPREIRVSAEYMAERFALDYAKSNFPLMYREAPKLWKRDKKKIVEIVDRYPYSIHSVYLEAFHGIPEYSGI